MRITPSLALLATLALLTACNGGSSAISNPLNPSSGDGFFRFVNGSADSGSVDVLVDGTKINTAPVAYGTMTAYNKFAPGSHTIAINVSSTGTAVAGLNASVLTQSVNGGAFVSLVLVGEQHPTVTGDTPNLLAFNDQTYSTGSGGFTIDFHNAAPVTASGSTQLAIASSGGTQNIGAAVSIGGTTQPTGIPSTFVNANMAVTFTATPSNTAVSAVHMTPSDIDSSGCAANTLPCNSGNLSLYFIDGPAASSSPTPPNNGAYPDGITASQMATFTGLFDANGT